MARLILIFALLVIAVFAVTMIATMARTFSTEAAKGGDRVPDSFQKIAYVLLIVLMFGITTGWLGAG